MDRIDLLRWTQRRLEGIPERISRIYKELAKDPVLHDYNSVPQSDPDPSFWGRKTELLIKSWDGEETPDPMTNWDEVHYYIEHAGSFEYDILEYLEGTDKLVNIYTVRPVFLKLTKEEREEIGGWYGQSTRR